MNKRTENYIEHEVRLRLHDEKFIRHDEDIKSIKKLLFSILGIGITSIILPVFLHAYRLT